ncbi:MAG: hypothetical protein ACTSRI_02550 [Promethearchaeota archaeon]
MLSHSYSEYIYQIKGEKIENNPDIFFDEKIVYLIIDKNLKLIWIWAGKRSKLFHRYMASTWAGKLKSRKKFYNFKYEMVRERNEPEEFLIIFNEIIEGRTDLKYPGESRTFTVKSKKSSSGTRVQLSRNLSTSKKTQIKNLLSEINEMQMHMKYTIDHIGRRITTINELLDK